MRSIRKQERSFRKNPWKFAQSVCAPLAVAEPTATLEMAYTSTFKSHSLIKTHAIIVSQTVLLMQCPRRHQPLLNLICFQSVQRMRSLFQGNAPPLPPREKTEFLISISGTRLATTTSLQPITQKFF